MISTEPDVALMTFSIERTDDTALVIENVTIGENSWIFNFEKKLRDSRDTRALRRKIIIDK